MSVGNDGFVPWSVDAVQQESTNLRHLASLMWPTAFAEERTGPTPFRHKAVFYGAAMRGASLSSPFCRNVTPSIFPATS